MDPNAIGRSPVTDSELGYPTLTAHGEGRRRFMKLCALSTAAAALGLELVGCPKSGGSGTGVTFTPPQIPVPWTLEEHIGGKMAMPMGAPVAVVVGGGPIAVTFQDGVSMDLVVAAVVTPRQGTDVKKDFTSLTNQQTKAVQDTAKGQPSSVVADATTVQIFEDLLRQAINKTLPSGYVNEVSIAKAEKPAASVSPSKAPTEKTSEAKKMKAAPESKSAPTPTVFSQAPKAKRMWTPCRQPGCTSCGA